MVRRAIQMKRLYFQSEILSGIEKLITFRGKEIKMEKIPLNCKWLEHGSKTCPSYNDEALRDLRGTLTAGFHGDVTEIHKKAEAICAKCDVFEPESR